MRTLGELKTKGHNPYPHKFERTMSIPEYIKEFSSMGDGQHLESKTVSVTGMPCYLSCCSCLQLHNWSKKIDDIGDGPFV